MQDNHRAHTSHAVGTGFLATAVMTMLIYMAPLMGMPKMDIAAMLGSLFNGGQAPATMSGAWWVGMVIHLMMGTVVFPLLYAHFVFGLVPGKPWARGLTWGILLWAVMQMMVFPMMGKGFFASNTPQPFLFVLGTLMGHAVYGAILGAIAGPQAHRGPATSPLDSRHART